MNPVQEYIDALNSLSSKETDPVNEYLSALEEDEVDPVEDYISYVESEAKKETQGLKREILGGLSFQTADEIEAFVNSLENDTTYSEEKRKIDAERKEYQYYNPAISLGAEAIGALFTGFGTSSLLTKAGVKSLTAQGTLEGGVYETARGNTPEERAVGAVLGATAGAIGGRALDAVTGRSMPTPEPYTPPAPKKDEIIDYFRSDGSTVMARVIGEEGDDLVLTTDLMGAGQGVQKTFKVKKDSPDIEQRIEPDLEGNNVTPIERVPVGEETPYSPLTGGQYQPVRFQRDIVEGPEKPKAIEPEINVPESSLPKTAIKSAKRVIADLAPELKNIQVITASSFERLMNQGLDTAAISAKYGVDERIVQRITDKWDRIVSAKDTGIGLRGTSFGDGKVFVNDFNIKPEELSLTLDHELGHEAARVSLGNELRKHLDWTRNGAHIKVKTDLGKQLRKEFEDNFNQIKEAYGSSYKAGQFFEEYLADNIAIWARQAGTVKPKTKLEKWFASQAEELKKIWTTISKGKRQRLTEAQKAESLRKFIDDFAESNRASFQRPTKVTRVVEGGVVPGQVKTPAFREAAPTQWNETIYGPSTGPSWRDAKTAGELWDGIKAGFSRKYDRLTPMTDLLQRRVSREVGARAQRADEAATKQNQLDFETYVQPIEGIVKFWDDNAEFRRMTLYYSENSMSRKDYVKYIADEFGADEAKRMDRYLKWSIKENEAYNALTSKKPKEQNYLHRQWIWQTKEEAEKELEKEFTLSMDVGQLSRERNVKFEFDRGDKSLIDKYQNPFLTNTRRIMNNRKVAQYAEKFGVKSFDGANTPELIMGKVRDAMMKRGISQNRADFAIQEIKRNMLGERKMMNTTLQALQTLGYAGSLAGPKSALLNIHDIPQTAVNQGPAALRSWYRGIIRDKNGKMLADSFGFSQQAKFGEFANVLQQSLATRGGMAKSLNNTANKTTDALMKVSLFQLMDKVGKGGVLRTVQQRAVDDVTKGGWEGLKGKWGTYFSDSELKTIARDLRRHGMDDSKYSAKGLQLTEELMMAGLGQQQLISAGGRPAFWADHPNARIFLALRGFAMKQQAVALRNTLQNAQEGNVQEAKDWAIRYALYSMGGFAVINEGRQILFGDGDPSPRRMVRSFFDQLVGVASLNSASINDYSWGKIQRGELLSYIIDNNTPIAIGVPAEAVEDVFDTLTGEKPAAELPETLPLIKQIGNFKENVEEYQGMLTGG